jgi:hypothetical protein
MQICNDSLSSGALDHGLKFLISHFESCPVRGSVLEVNLKENQF